jgi:thiol-disulfide isomerase/thioredoxin
MLRLRYFTHFRAGLLILLFPLFVSLVRAGNNMEGYSIRVKITNCTDSLLYLNHYSGKDIINDDTARMNATGYYNFEGKNNLDEGLYYISSDVKKRYFDFFITDKQNIQFEYNQTGLLKTITTSDTIENRTYFKILAFLQSDVSLKGFAQNDSIQYLLNHSDLSVPIIQQIVGKSENNLSLSEKYIKACIPPSVFQYYFLKKKLGKKEPPLRIYLDHFFDNFDFSDSRLINTPIFAQRLDEFIDTIAAIPSSSSKAEVDRLILLSSANKRTQEFVVWYLISRFETYYFLPENDALYVHIVRDFLENGKISWYYPEVKEREISQANKFEPLINGKIGPDLEMPDTSGIYHSLYSVKARYTLLLFWASTCSHCRDEMPSIIKFYKDFHKNYNLEIFGVSTDTSTVRWKSYVHRHQLPWINVFGRKGRQSYFHLYNIQTTPTVFLLDDKKTILAKYLTPEKAGEIIRKRELANGKK